MTYNISLVDSLILVSSCILVIVGEHIQRWKNQVFKIQQHVKIKVSNETENDKKKITKNDAKKKKRLTEIQVLTKDFT